MATSYANNGGTGDRRVEILVSTDFVSSAGDLGGGVAISDVAASVLIDSDTAAGGREFGSGNNATARFIKFDFGVGASIVIDEFKLYIQTTTAFGTFTWEGSNNGSSWTTIGASFTLGTAGTNTVARTNSTGYRYYRLNTTSFAGGAGGRWYEFEFKIEDITPQASRASYYNVGGFGNRTGLVTVTTTGTLATGTIDNAVDGVIAATAGDGFVFTGAQSAIEVKFDFGASSTSTVIDVVAFWMSSASTHGTWKVQGSANGSSWTDVGSTFTWGGIVGLNRVDLGGNTTGYRYYRLLNTAGSTNGVVNNEEIEFRIQGVGSVSGVGASPGVATALAVGTNAGASTKKTIVIVCS